MYDLPYACAKKVVSKKEKYEREKRVFFKFFEQFGAIVLCLNVFILCCGFPSFSLVKNITTSFAPSVENFGKLKFVFKEEDDKFPMQSSEFTGFVLPFTSCFFDSKNSTFVSGGNKFAMMISSGVVEAVRCENKEKTVQVKIDDDLKIIYKNLTIVGVKEKDFVKSGMFFAFCESGELKVEIFVDGEKIEIAEIFEL